MRFRAVGEVIGIGTRGPRRLHGRCGGHPCSKATTHNPFGRAFGLGPMAHTAAAQRRNLTGLPPETPSGLHTELGFSVHLSWPLRGLDRSAGKTPSVPRPTAAFALFVLTAGPVLARPLQAPNALADTTVLIIRHAEKPPAGTDLTPAGVARAEAYPAFFRKYRASDGKAVRIDYIFATADSKGSHRERLTMEPLAKSLGLKLDLRFKNKEYGDLVDAMKAKSYGRTILICWHHGHIPDMVGAFGGDSTKLLPGGKWPDDHFDYVIELHFDHAGKLARERRTPA